MKRVSKEIGLLDSVPEVVEHQAMPSLITLSEFILTLSKLRSYYFESLGSFSYWIKKEGCPKKWPFDMWKAKFDEFLIRKA